MTTPLKTLRAAALLVTTVLALTACAATAQSETDTSSAAAEPSPTQKELTPQEKATAFRDVKKGAATEAFKEVHLGGAETYSLSEFKGNKAVESMEILGMIYGGFPEHQKASFEWTEAEVQRASEAFAPYLYDGFEAQFADSLRKHNGGLIITSARTIAEGTNPPVVTARDGSTCTLTDAPWSIGFTDQQLDVGPDVSPAGGGPMRTIRLDYRTNFTIDCADGAKMFLSQPKHLSFVEKDGEWLAYEYGREDHAAIEIKPAT
ncbi:hypothetical protein [Arthrobacter sp. Cr_A7]|uniref:hypothetical protein n=1 Tax=Arthrobacter sp. Cr_A7 TaxID=3031017 RepID=UPI0023DA68B2|nr:hypothetical protein [Arthrobacter sp. Cr_A7]MDF2048873.1 hypothetical protein [Arthrobacter sp. Cr_A7]